MSTNVIKIQPNPKPTPTQPAVFVPATVDANAGDNLTWHNADNQAHWPAPSKSNPTGFIQFQIPPGGSSRGDLALAANIVAVTAATNADPIVLTLNGPAPPSGTTITMAYTAPPSAPASAVASSGWKKVNGDFEATKLGPNTCSLSQDGKPFDGSTFGPFTPNSGSLTLSSPLAYTLDYECALHPDEKGHITVNPQP